MQKKKKKATVKKNVGNLSISQAFFNSTFPHKDNPDDDVSDFITSTYTTETGAEMGVAEALRELNSLNEKPFRVTEHSTKGAYNSYGYLSNMLYVDKDRTSFKGTVSGDEITEGIDWEVPDDKKGGIITVANKVNAVQMDENALKDWIKKKLATMSNRLFGTRKLDKISKRNKDVYGYTIGKFLHGRYKSQSEANKGKVFDEDSISVEIVGVDSKTLLKVAEEICRDFVQETVLVKDYNTGKVFFVNRD